MGHMYFAAQSSKLCFVTPDVEFLKERFIHADGNVDRWAESEAGGDQSGTRDVEAWRLEQVQYILLGSNRDNNILDN